VKRLASSRRASSSLLVDCFTSWNVNCVGSCASFADDVTANYIEFHCLGTNDMDESDDLCLKRNLIMFCHSVL
jgi:hypothetical protein